MRAAIFHAPRRVEVGERPDPTAAGGPGRMERSTRRAWLIVQFA
jgi:hypothetical protein